MEAFFTHAGLAAAGAAAVCIPILIHLLTRFRRRPVGWGAMRFVLEAYRRHRTRLQLEQWLLLLVRCLLLFILGMALAGPLLPGCAQNMGLDSGGRLVNIVIDDSLSTRTEAGEGSRRFDRLKATALRLVDQLSPADMVTLWRTARPGRAVISPGTLDHKAVAREIRTMQPRYSRADVQAAMALIDEDTQGQNQPRDRTFTVLISDLGADTLPIGQPASGAWASLTQSSRLLLLRPASPADNVQIQAVELHRRMVLAQGAAGPATTPVSVKLLRFGRTDGEQVTRVTLTGGRTVTREHRWGVGQREATLNVNVPLAGESSDSQGSPAGDAASAQSADTVATNGQSGANAQGGRIVLVAAAIDDDALKEDNRRLSLVEMRDHLTVGLVDQLATITPDARSSEFQPHEWLRLALAPQTLDDLSSGVSETGIRLVSADAGTLGGETLAGWDAALVLRPDLLDDDGWVALNRLALRGGLVWFFVPPTPTMPDWTERLPRQFAVDWTLGLEASTPGGPPGEADEAEAAGDSRPVTVTAAPPTGAGEGTAVDAWRLETNTTTPEPVALLAADWQDLLSPVRIHRRIDFVPAGGESNAWLQMPDGKALMAMSRVGQGAVVLLASALDSSWTNLPTKPLFVPLLHETLRGVLGQTAATNTQTAECGQQPVLGRAWEGVQRLAPVAPLQADDSPGSTVDPVLLRRTDVGFVPVTTLDQPGLFAGSPTGSGLKLAVNVDAAGGNTQTLNEQQCEEWLNSLVTEAAKTPGESWGWLDEDNPIESLAAYRARANIGWPLLWAVLGLAIAELFLARWFSHANARTAGPFGGSGAGGILAQAAQRVRVQK